MKKNYLMVLGTSSSVGKSIITAGILRVLKNRGYSVAPFKAQNMALNSYITKEGLEMGRAQVIQAEAAKIEPSVSMNPVLLKPSSNKVSQVIILGKATKNMSAVEYHEYKDTLKPLVKDEFMKLSNKYDFVIVEGAGSPAEINLREKDIVNMGFAELVDSDAILVGDIDRGGVFASIYGTIMLLNEEERKRIKGIVINKFRGDKSILQPGLEEIERLTNIPVLGVIPFLDMDIEDEDSLTTKFKKTTNNKNVIDIEILKLPHISNFTDFDPLFIREDVNVKYIYKEDEITEPDLLIIPGTKSTISDLMYLRDNGFYEDIVRLNKKGKRILGICGGFQMLGNKIIDEEKIESDLEEINGLGLLDTITRFKNTKVTTRVSGFIVADKFKNIDVNGYEIHMGETKRVSNKPFINLKKRLNDDIDILDGAISDDGNVIGTYLHGIFEDDKFLDALLEDIKKSKLNNKINEVTGENKGGSKELKEKTKLSYKEYKEKEFDKLAEHIEKNLDVNKILELLNE